MQATEMLIPRAHARLRRIDLRIVLGLVLMLVAVLGGVSLIRTAQARTPVLVAAGVVQPGELIEASDLRAAEVALPGDVSFLSAERQSEIVGRVAAEPLWDGKVLSEASVATGPPIAPGTVAITLLLPDESAVGGQLRSGDRVAVLASASADHTGEDAATLVALAEVPVLSVRSMTEAGAPAHLVTLNVTLEEARSLAEARSRGRLDLALLPAPGGP